MRELIAAAYPDHGILGEEYWPRPGRRRVRLGARPDRRHQVVHHRPAAVRHPDRARASRAAHVGRDRPVDPARALGRGAGGSARPGTAGRSACAPAPGSRTRCCSRPAPPCSERGAENEAFDRVQRRVRLPMYGGDCYAYGLLAMGFADLVVEAGLQPYDFMALVPVIEGAGGAPHRLARRHPRPRLEGRPAVVAAGDGRIVHRRGAGCSPIVTRILSPSGYPMAAAAAHCSALPARSHQRRRAPRMAEAGSRRGSPAAMLALRLRRTGRRWRRRRPHGVAMHGEPKYPPDFTHFDYVNPNAPKGGSLAWRRSAPSTTSTLHHPAARRHPLGWCSRR